MSPGTSKPQPERDKTDESLRSERESSDQAMAESRADIEKTADEVVEHAREQADAVLDSARDKADHKLAVAETGLQMRTAIVQERTRAAEILQDERHTADEALRRQREESANTLSALLPLEREKTDRHLLTERARHDDSLAHRDDFLAMVSHDLRNLLCGVLLEANLLSDAASDSEEGRRTVAGMNRLQRYAARMNRLIGDLVDVVSIDAGKLTVRPKPGDAVALLAEAVAAFMPAALEKGITLDSATVEPVLLAEFDHDRMLQVLANVITNALKFTPRGGAIVIRGERSGDGLRLSVNDTGMGIPSGMLGAVFERFWQAGKNDARGLGLGLYISQCIIDAHGGKIWAESRIGAGSTFYITLPGAAAQAA